MYPTSMRTKMQDADIKTYCSSSLLLLLILPKLNIEYSSLESLPSIPMKSWSKQE
ncbi:hypothetical protein Mapa_013375 [Marchantia paleacea]|nr:hypothetical protein Mapa_013375 [Marchantia paleacea]